PETKNPPRGRVVEPNQHHTQISSIAAGTKQEQNTSQPAKTEVGVHGQLQGRVLSRGDFR
ncbi:hypothetical protein, partial [Mesorhizobium sp.]|uniref:hypothetical protein n=1 Tax=Mesorhizobium sp. TaxID=1871066 RepID=UPI0025DF6FDD